MQTAPHSVSVDSNKLAMIVLEGSPEARAKALRLALGDEGLRGKNFFGRLVSGFARQGTPNAPKILLSRLDQVAYRLLGRSIAKRFDEDSQRLFRALAIEDPSFGGHEELLRSHISLDLLFMLSVISQKLGLSLPAPSMCSCFAAWGKATTNGKLYVGRNFDFPAYRLDAPPSWIVLERPQGGIDHISLYHAPGYMPGITSINREGLIVGVLMNFAKKVTPFGTPILSLAKSVIQGAKTIDDVRAILRRSTPASGWTFFVAETNKRRVTVFETSASGVGEVTPEDDFHFSANRFRSSTLLGLDTAPSHAWHEHNLARESRLASLARELFGRIDAKTIAEILGDSLDPETKRYRSLGPAIAAGHNTGSAVFAPEDDSLFVASEGWPSNSAGTYTELSLGALFQGRIVPKGAILPPNRTGSAREGIVAYLQATSLLLQNEDDSEALRSLDRAISHEPEEATFRTARAVLRLRRADAEGARIDAEQALAHETWAARRSFADLLLGNALDLKQERSAALSAYQRAQLGPEEKVSAAAKRFLKRPFTKSDAKNLGFDPLMSAPA